MENESIKKSNYGFLAAVFLVIALGLISTLFFLSNKHSAELVQTVKDFRNNKYEIDKLDEAIQLLYKAENNSREYILTKSPEARDFYSIQLSTVSHLLDSISNEKKEILSVLVEDKRKRTEAFIHAKLLADSLIRLNLYVPVIKTVTEEQVVHQTPQSLPPQTVAEKKVVEEQVVTRRQKKNLFQRIGAAIRNEPKEESVKNVTIYKTQPIIVDTVKIRTIERVQMASTENPLSKLNLSKKELQLLNANRTLFEELQNILQRLKVDEQNLRDTRQQQLSDNANLFIDQLQDASLYILLFSLLLTFVILVILLKLFHNGRVLQQATKRAKEYAQYKSDFIALLSHEIRTPLQNIHAYSDELSRQKKGEQTEIIHAIKLSSNTLLSIVNNILDITKIEKGKFKLMHSPFNPTTIVQEVASGMLIQTKRKKLSLETDIDPSADQPLYGDPFYFRQLLTNVVSNAVKYTHKGGIQVRINFVPKDTIKGILHLFIQDDGIGIDEKKLPFIFDAFSEQNHTIEIKEGSTGLGLSVVKKIVDMHQGQIEVKSAINKGTTFHIQLPYDCYITPDKLIEDEPLNRSDCKILVVENDKLNSRLLEILLKDQGYVLIHASNGKEALETFVKDDFDQIITDISMPGMNGYEFAKEIRNLADPHKANVPIIAITGFDAPENSDSKLFDAWFTKPFQNENLLEKIQTLCTYSHK